MDGFWTHAGHDNKPNCAWRHVFWFVHANCNFNAAIGTRRVAIKIQSYGKPLDIARRSNHTRIIQKPVLVKGNTMEFLKELWAFLRVRKKVWLAPIIMMMLILGGLLIFAQGSVVAPFIYTLF